MRFQLFSVSIRAKDVKKLASFYKDTFKLKAREERAGLVVLEAGGGVCLVIRKISGSPEKAAPAPEKNVQLPPSRYGLAFEVDDIDAAYKSLKAKLDISMPPVDEDWGARTASGRDPEGNRIDLIQRSKAAAAR